MEECRSAWVRGGKIPEIAWVDRDVIAWCSSAHVVFFDLIKREDTVYWCSESIDGACCISGNPAMHLVGFAEKCNSPRILVFSYLNMILISECRGGTENGYLATAFASSEFIVSLGSYPNYLMIVWNWKTGEKLSCIPTAIQDIQGQSIKVSESIPTWIAHLGKDSGRLFIWKIVTTSTIIMSCEEVLLPDAAKPVHVDWSTDHGDVQLAMVDKHGHVYICNKDGSEVNRVVFSQRCGLCLEYETPAVCWFQGGIMLKTTFCQIRFYKKREENIWRRERYVKSILKPYLLTRHPFASSKLFYFTAEGFLMEMNLPAEEGALNIEEKFYYGGIYSFMDLIYPWGHHLVVIDDSCYFYIIDVMTARLISKLKVDLEGQVTYLVSHPDYPMVAIITKSGELALVAVHVPNNPTVAFKYRLQNDELDFLKFSHCGRHLIVGEKKSGICYCIVSTGENPFSMIYQFESRHRITDVVLYDEKGVLKVLILGHSSRRALVGHYVIIYELLPSQEKFMEPTNVIQLPTIYQCLHYAPETSQILIATPYRSRQIHFLHIKAAQEINLIRAVSTRHNIRQLKIYSNRRYITTSGFDGIVTVFENKQSPEASTILLSHHRKDLGVSKAICSPSGQLVIALGRNGSLVCLELKQKDKEHPEDESERRKMVSSDYSNLDSTIFAMLSRPCQIIPPVIDDLNKTWVEWKREQIVLHEEEKCSRKKSEIQRLFNKLKTKVVTMLDDNENCLNTEKLPVAAFDLAVLTREQKLKIAREEREDARCQLEFECSSMNKVSNWIKTTFWDPQSVVSKSIFSIFGDTEVPNYPTFTEDPQDRETIRWVHLLKDRNIKTQADFRSEPKPYALIKHRYKSSHLDEKSVIENLLIDDDESEDEEEKKKEQQASEGTTTHRFVERSSHYSQFEVYAFAEFILMHKDLINDAQLLRNYFNKLLEQMVKVKEHEMAMVHEQIAKIHDIDSELRSMFGQSVPEILDNPEWHWAERPESIIEVTDTEVKVRPYLSDSQQELLDKQTAEAERIRLLLMVDNFREKALLTMMDGVLEVRWEDIIKKDVPKPRCMLMKEPEEYNVEDLLSVQKYEKDIQTLKQEREKYRRILEGDYSKAMRMLKEGIDKFNSSLQDFSLIRMKVESAIQQLNLIRAREYLRVAHRWTRLRETTRLQEKIVEREKDIEEVLEQNRVLQGLFPSLRTQREELLAKEKIMVKKFRKEFPSLSKVIVDSLRKQYKKRPNVSLKNSTAGELVELGRCVRHHIISDYINSHCVAYLAGVNTIDIQPAGLPESVTPYHWDHLVKIRRLKIELEMELKANWTEINEIERGIAQNNKKIGIYKGNISDLGDQLAQMKQTQIDFESDIEIQLVLTMGQLEINLQGQRDETKNSMFLPKIEIERFNKEILEAGAEKSRAMNRAITFQRGTLFKEWEHQCLKMKMDDLADEFHQIRSLFVTKDIQVFLRRLSLGQKDDKTRQQLEREIQAMKSTSQQLLKDSVLRLESIEAKIEATRTANTVLDKAITRMNVQRWGMELKRDLDSEDRQKDFSQRKLELALRRSKLVRKIQQEYTDFLTLQTEYERLCSKKYPSLSFFRVMGDEFNRKEV